MLKLIINVIMCYMYFGHINGTRHIFSDFLLRGFHNWSRIYSKKKITKVNFSLLKECDKFQSNP